MLSYELRRIASEKILTSWFESSSRAPKPSVSTINTLIGSPSGVNPDIGLPHTHNPYLSKSQDQLMKKNWQTE